MYTLGTDVEVYVVRETTTQGVWSLLGKEQSANMQVLILICCRYMYMVFALVVEFDCMAVFGLFEDTAYIAMLINKNLTATFWIG